MDFRSIMLVSPPKDGRNRSVLFSLLLVFAASLNSWAQVTSVSVSPAPTCAGTAVTVTFSSSTTGMKTYTASLSDASGSFTSPIATASGSFNKPTGKTLTINIPSGATTSSLYQVKVSASGVTALSSSAFIINAIPSITMQPSTTSQDLCQNSTAISLSIVASAGSGSISSYQWYSNTTSSNSGGSSISGATSSSYTPSTSAIGTLYYYCVVTNSNGCSVTSSVSGSVIVRAIPTASNISASAANTATSKSTTVTVSSTTLATGTYSVTYSVNGTNTITITTATMSFTAGNPGTGTFTTSVLTNAGTANVLSMSAIAFSSTPLCASAISAITPAFATIQSYTTLSSGNWNDPSTWSPTPSTYPDASFESIIIVSGHSVTIPSGVIISADQLTINGSLNIAQGGQLTIANGDATDITLGSGGTLSVSGTLELSDNATHAGLTSSNLVFASGSRYRHLYTTTEGILPSASWNAASTLEITGYTTLASATSTGNWSQSFGNVELNCASQISTLSLAGLLTTVTGNLSISSTGSGILQLAKNQVITISIGGSVTVSGTSQVYFSAAPASGTSVESVTMNIGGDFNYNSTNVTGSVTNSEKLTTFNITGNFNMNAPGGKLTMLTKTNAINATDGTVFNLGGNFQLTAGTIYADDSNSGRIGDFNFTGATNTTHTFYNNGSIQGAINYTVNKGNILQTLGESAIQGGTYSTFTLGETTGGATLILESTDINGAIQTGLTAGNLRVGNSKKKRTFNSNSYIIYRGASAQYMGNGQPGTSSSGGTASASVTTIIDNASGVSLNSNTSTVIVTGILEIDNGDLTAANNNLTVSAGINLVGGDIYLNSSDATVSSKTLTSNGVINLTGGQIHFISGTANNDNAAFILGTSGDFTGTNYFTFSGPNCRVTINAGTLTTFSRPLPVNASTTLEVLTMNRAGATLEVSQPLTVGKAANSSSGLFLTNGNLKMNAALTCIMVARMTNGILYFEGQTIELQRNINTTYPAGVMSADASSTLQITTSFSGTTNTLAFSPSGNTLGTLILNRSATTTPLVSLNSELNISGSLYLSDGTFYNQSGLSMSSGSTLYINPNASFSTGSIAPAGGPYNIVYNDGSSPTSTSITTGIETTGSIKNVTCNMSNTLTCSTALIVQGALTLNTGTFNNTAGLIAMASSSSLIRNSSSTFIGVGPSGAYDLYYTGSNLSSGPEANGQLVNIFSTTTGTVTLSSSVSGTGTLNINSGTWTSASNDIEIASIANQSTFNAPGTTLYLSGDLTNNGTFNHNNGTVEFAGSSSLLGSANPAFNHVTISGTLNAPSVLNIEGNFSNNGTFSSSGGKVVTFLGSTTQLITGTSVTDFNDLNIINTAVPSVRVETKQNLKGTLTLLDSSIFDADGSLDSATFTVVSQSDSLDARIATIPSGASVIGKVNVQRYMSGEGRIYRYLSSPVTNASVADWMDDFPVTGNFKDPSGYPKWPKTICGSTISTKSTSMYYYDETKPGAASQGYVAYPVVGTYAASNKLEVGRGYVPFIRQCTSATIVDVKGTINQGIISLPVTYTNTLQDDTASIGWNLIGNPYPSAIDWNEDGDLNGNGDSTDVVDGWSKVNIGAAIAVRDNGSGMVRYWDGDTSDNGLTAIPAGIIATGQGFWVRATGANPQLIIREGVKSAGGSEFFRKETVSGIVMTLTHNGMEDRAYIKIRPASKETLDYWDAPKLDNEFFDLATMSSDNQAMAINAVPSLNCKSNIQLKLTDLTKGSYQFKISRKGTLEQQYEFTLSDHYAKTSKQIQWDEIVIFDVTDDAASKASNRFSMQLVNALPQNVSADATAQICHADGKITIANSQFGIKYSVWNDQDKKLTQGINGNGSQIVLVVPMDSLSAGQNNVVVRAQNLCGVFGVTPTISMTVESPAIDHVVDGKSCLAGSVLLGASSKESGTYKWYANSNDVDPIYEGQQYQTPVIGKTKTFYVSITTASGCESERKSAEAAIINFDNPIITADGNILTNSYSENVQWYLNDVVINGATSQVYEAKSNGNYTTITTISGCEARASYSLTITGVVENANGVSIYPNPASEKFIVNVPKSKNLVTAYLVSITGVRMHVNFVKDDAGVLIIQLDQIADGLYTLNLVFDDFISVYKVVKAK